MNNIENSKDIEQSTPETQSEVESHITELLLAVSNKHEEILNDKGKSRRIFLAWGLVWGWVASIAWGLSDKILNIFYQSKKSSEIMQKIPSMRRDMYWSLLHAWLDHNKINNILNSLVILHGDWVFGTWFFIDKNIILTAGHVISTPKTQYTTDFSQVDELYQIYDLYGNTYKASIIYWDSKNDLGGVIVDTPGRWSLELINNTIESGDRITIWFWWEHAHVTTGEEITHFSHRNLEKRDIDRDGIPDGQQLWFTTNIAIGGDSGGPTVDKNGNVVWVTVNRLSSREKITDTNGKEFSGYINYAWYEPLPDIRDFLWRMGKYVDSL